jgi:hypothetical protein
MFSLSLRRAAAPSLLLFAAAFAACGGDDDTSFGTPGTGGSGGKAGAAGKGGMPGKGGSSGKGGAAGKGGASGKGGSAGKGGEAGDGGKGGTTHVVGGNAGSGDSGGGGSDEGGSGGTEAGSGGADAGMGGSEAAGMSGSDGGGDGGAAGSTVAGTGGAGGDSGSAGTAGGGGDAGGAGVSGVGGVGGTAGNAGADNGGMGGVAGAAGGAGGSAGAGGLAGGGNGGNSGAAGNTSAGAAGASAGTGGAGGISGAGGAGAAGAAGAGGAGASCSNHVKDAGESDVDCGGPCARCAKDQACVTGGDCLSTLCSAGVCTPKLLISELRTRGSHGGNDELVELFNPGDEPVFFNGDWSVVVRSVPSTGCGADGERFNGKNTPKLIPARSNALWVNPGDGDYDDPVPPDAGYSVSISDAGSIRLVYKGTVSDALCFAYDAPTSTTLTTCSEYVCEGVPASNLPHNNTTAGEANTDRSLTRKHGPKASELVDTGNNATDFEMVASTPRNLGDGPLP